MNNFRSCPCEKRYCDDETKGLFPEKISLAVAYIPFQQWDEDGLYDPQTALVRGSLFKQLDKPWKGGCC